MTMLDTTMAYDEVEEALHYMLPYLDDEDKAQIKSDIDNNSIIYTKEQYNSLCATLYSLPSNNIYNDLNDDFNDIYYEESVDAYDYVSYIPIDQEYFSIPQEW